MLDGTESLHGKSLASRHGPFRSSRELTGISPGHRSANSLPIVYKSKKNVGRDFILHTPNVGQTWFHNLTLKLPVG